MSSHSSDQMFQRSQVSRVALCMSKVKVLSVSESVSASVTRFAESQIWLTYCLRNCSSVRTQFLGPLCLWQCFLLQNPFVFKETVSMYAAMWTCGSDYEVYKRSMIATFEKNKRSMIATFVVSGVVLWPASGWRQHKVPGNGSYDKNFHFYRQL